MRNRIIIAIASLFIAVTALADDGYKFHIRVTDARTAVSAEPQLKLSEAQLQQAAQTRVLLLDHGSGAHWRWVILNWLKDKPATEQGVNARGTAAPGKDADIGLLPLSEKTVRLRCYRDACTVHVVAANKKESSKSLHKNETAELPFDSDFELTFN